MFQKKIGIRQGFLKSNSEKEQAILRVIFATLIFIYLLAESGFDNKQKIHDAVMIYSGCFLLFSISLLGNVFFRPAPSKKRQLLAMFADLGSVTFGMMLTREVGTLFYGIYLWVILGNGLRYGTRSLIQSYTLAIGGFISVILFNDYWQQHSTLAMGLLLTLILIPLYIYTLLDRLNQAITHAKEANKAKSYFLANMSHEMRTPLNGVIGAGDLILSTPLNAEQKDLIKTLRNSGHILLKLIEDVLDFSKIESGKLTTQIVDFDLHGMINSIMDMFSSQAKKKGLQLYMSTSPETCFLLRGDAQHLRQIIINLVGNAIKFTNSGQVELRVSTLAQDETSTRLRFEVIDTGIGIPEESQHAIFESFTQAHADISRNYGGTGLGTTISKQLVNIMGGEIGLHSAVNQGSTFWFELPFEKPIERRTQDKRQALCMMRVFGIGMTDSEQASVSSSLTGWGSWFNHSSTFEQLTSFIGQMSTGVHRNHVVLCRPATLGMNATDFSSRLQAKYPSSEVSLILLDGDTEVKNESELLRLGYSCVLRSPIDKTLLFNAVHGVMTSSSSEDEDVISFMKHYERASMEKKQLQILVADDNGTNRMIISKILGRAGHHADLAEDGEQALDMLEAKRYDLAILDMHMPVLHGLEALKIYRMSNRTSPVMPIIILTANATTEAKRECEEAGADLFLTKPVDAYTLLNSIAGLTTHLMKLNNNLKVTENNAKTEVANATPILNENTLHHLRLLCDDQSDFLKNVIQGFISEGETLLDAMDAAFLINDYKSIKELAHALKGSSGNVGADSLSQVCRDISQLNLTELQESASDLLARVRNDFGASRAAMINYLEAPQQATRP